MHQTSLKSRLRFAFLLYLSLNATSLAKPYTLIGWNNLGMHCMDSDYTVFSVLPPYNTIHAQLIDGNGILVRNPAGITVTYQAVADPSGSENRTSIGKTNFWDQVQALFGVALPPDQGLTGLKMPGTTNQPQPMTFDTAHVYFIAEGIPITAYDDQGHKNPYPMMRLVAKDSFGQILATADIVLPVSDEMDCRACHGSGSGPEAQPDSGWVNDPNPDRDYRLNILRHHDDHHGQSLLYKGLLQSKGYNPNGLFETVQTDHRPILCASCHASNALPGTGAAGVPDLTRAVHAMHADVTDPTTKTTLDDSANRSACYRCHPGAETRCLRGVMGNAVAQDGSKAIQCQSCHGNMSAVGAATREGWLSEPACQSCHTGTAINNRGSIRFTTVFDATGQVRTPADPRYATNANVPAAGYSLYRFSSGHGRLTCEACHGSTHAEYASSHANDNVQILSIQGHPGTLGECLACHAQLPSTVNGGPHGMHPVGQAWVGGHAGAAEAASGPCRDCHGADYRGTVLSRMLADRILNTGFGTKSLFRGSQIGCYACHKGPGDESGNSNRRPAVGDVSAAATPGVPVVINLNGSDADGNFLTFRVVDQPSFGTATISGTQATYYPASSALGSDSFTYAAWDGSIDSNLGKVSVTLLVPPANRPPQVQVGQKQLVLAGRQVTLSASATDPDGDPVTYAWTQLSGPPVTLTNPNSTSCSFTAPAVSQVTTLMFRVTVKDGKGGIATQDAAVDVAPAFSPQALFYFPQIGNGAAAGLQLQSSVFLFSPTAPSDVTVDTFDTQGNPLPLPWLGQPAPGASLIVHLAKGESMVLTTAGTGVMQSGYARVAGSAPVVASALFALNDVASGIRLSEAGILPGIASSKFSLFVDSVGSADTALAVLNPPDQSPADATLTLRLYDKAAKLVSTKTLTVPDGDQIAKFMWEIFDDAAQTAREMQGTMSVESTQPVVALTIRQTADPTKPFPASVPVMTVFPVLTDVVPSP